MSGVNGFANGASCPSGTCAASHLFHKASTSLMKDFRKQDPLYKRAGIIHAGSAYEKTMVGDQIEFDEHVVIYAKDIEVTPGNSPGRYTLKPSSSAKGKYEKFLDDGLISPTTFRNKIVGDFQKCINKDADMKVAIVLRQHGPAVQHDFYHKDHLVFSADIVPTIKVRTSKSPYTTKMFVPKPDPTGEQPSNWRESFSLQEREKVRHMGDSHNGTVKALIRTCKAMTKVDDSLKPMNSFLVKNLVFHYNDQPNKPDWRRQNLPDHVLGIMKFAHTTLNKQKLTLYFEPSVNLYADMKKETIQQLANRFERLTTNDQEQQKFFKRRLPTFDEEQKGALRELHDMKVDQQQAVAKRNAPDGYITVTQDEAPVEEESASHDNNNPIRNLFDRFYYKKS